MALRVALDYMHSFGADIIAVALGLDAAISDPFEGLRHDVLLLGINLITADAFLKGIFSG